MTITIPVTDGYAPTVELTSGDEIIKITDKTAEHLEYGDYRGWVVEQGGQFAGNLTEEQVMQLASGEALKIVRHAHPSGHDSSYVYEVR